jgi:hypothetical protein
VILFDARAGCRRGEDRHDKMTKQGSQKIKRGAAVLRHN